MSQNQETDTNQQLKDSLSNRSTRILAMALEKKQQEFTLLEKEITTRERQLKMASNMRSHRWITFLLILLAFLIVVYAVYANYRANTKIDLQYSAVIEEIKSAYRGDKAAYAKIIELIPEITKGRLPRILPNSNNQSYRPVW